jgi:hypothetical protein
MKGSPVPLSRAYMSLRACSRAINQSAFSLGVSLKRPRLAIYNISPSICRASSASTQQSYTDFYRYTSGRWLWDEDQQLRDRYSPFNVPELQKAAASSIGAQECVAMVKLAEGNFNKIFKLSMDNGLNVIARIPHPIAGPKYYTTASEVATMEFV